MEGNFSNRVQDVIRLSREEALRLGHDYIGTEHLLLGIIREGEGIAVKILRNVGIDLFKLKKSIEDTIRTSSGTLTIGNIPLTKQAEKVLKITYLEAKLYKSEVIGTEHLLLALLRDDDNIAAQILSQFSVSYEDVRKELDNIINGKNTSSKPEKMRPSSSKSQQPDKQKTPVLDNFGRDLTKLANEGKLDPVIGREKEIERVAQVLSRRKKNNPVLIGEPGVGKTAIVEGLALKIMEKKVSRVLFDKDASNMFKPALARGEIQCIGATTLDEYRQYIEKDGALDRRFQKVTVDPPTPEQTIQIINNVKDRYEAHHGVKYSDEAVKACVKLAERYITDRHLPDKALDVLDEAGARVHLANINVPTSITEIEQKIEEARQQKNSVVKAQNFEEAARLRDLEKRLQQELETAKEE